MVEESWLPQIDKELCTGCGDCVATCPSDALELASGVALIIDPPGCNYCAECEMICPVEAIALPYQIVLGTDL